MRSSGLAGVAEQRKLVVQYEDFCAAPERVFKSRCEKIDLNGAVYQWQDSFKVTREKELPNRVQIEQACAHWQRA
jgi:hypothetical protein